MKLNLSLLLLIVLAFAASLLAGRVWLPPPGAARRRMTAWPGLILYDIRLPRTVLALMVGAVLGLSGAVLQGFTRNPLAEPALLGVSSGAALGAVIAIYFGLAAFSPVTGPLMGMVGARGGLRADLCAGAQRHGGAGAGGRGGLQPDRGGHRAGAEFRAQSLCRL